MKLATCMSNGTPTLGVVDTQHQTILDIQRAHIALHGRADPAFASMLDLIKSGDAGLQCAREVVAASRVRKLETQALSSVCLLAPLPRPTQIRDFSVFPHHIEYGAKRLRAIQQGDPTRFDESIDGFPSIYREAPVFYFSNRMNVAGTDSTLAWPAGESLLDFELELAACIGQTGKDIARAEARAHIFGYTIFNDVSARLAQARQVPAGLGPCKGKSHDGCNVLGPWIVTPDELPDPYNLSVSVRVNGELWHESATRGMLHCFEDMIAFASAGETLHAGEVLGSGTVDGCCSLEIGRWVRPGDVVELGIEGIGTLRTQYGQGG
ncbi:fumarylacetoacetate hydrolase family protein [Paraburkholderia sp. J63]|uniref:fumarylacetoacetate hydrolase family protein n=1 Tax=Paraburkholderia sp. J63 TaxID=2805434 RepID=UPI002ABDF811|nr:fumarylacetoacetate hydrolase family protein [Paraburkholderia sp. J63]